MTQIILAEKGIAKTPKKDCIYTIDKIWVFPRKFSSQHFQCAMKVAKDVTMRVAKDVTILW